MHCLYRKNIIALSMLLGLAHWTLGSSKPVFGHKKISGRNCVQKAVEEVEHHGPPPLKAWSIKKIIPQDLLNHALVKAVQKCQLEAIKSLLILGADPNASADRFRHTPELSEGWRTKLANDSVRSGWDNYEQTNGPLHTALNNFLRTYRLLRLFPAYKPRCARWACIAIALLTYGATIPQVHALLHTCIESKHDSMPHMAAVRRALLAGGANPNHVYEHISPLIRAAYIGNNKAVIQLLEHGATLHYQNAQGVTPLVAAALAGNIRTIQLLLQHGATPPTTSQRALLNTTANIRVLQGILHDKHGPTQLRTALAHIDQHIQIRAHKRRRIGANQEI